MPNIKHIAIGLILGLLPVELFAQPEIVYGDGVIINPSKDVQPFERIVLSGPIDMTIDNDYSEHNCKSISISIDRNLLRYVRVSSKDRTLFISLPPYAIPSQWARAETDCKSIRHIRAENNGRFRLYIGKDSTFIKAENDDGIIRISGETKFASISAVNGGIINIKGLKAQKSSITAGKNSFVEANNSSNIDTSIEGNGTILLIDKTQSPYRMKKLANGVNVIAPNFYHHGFADAYFDKIEYKKLKPRLIEIAKNLSKGVTRNEKESK